MTVAEENTVETVEKREFSLGGSSAIKAGGSKEMGIVTGRSMEHKGEWMEVSNSSGQSKSGSEEDTKQGTFWSSVVSLFLSFVGVGLFVLTNYFGKAGWLVASISLIVAAITTDFSCWMLIRLAEKSQQGSFVDVTNFFLTPTLRRVSAILVILWVFGLILSCFKFGTEIVPVLKEWVGAPHPGILDEGYFTIFIVLLVFPACILKTLHNGRYISYLGTASLFGLVCLFFGLYFYTVFPLGKPPVHENVVAATTDFKNIIKMLCMAFLCFCGQFNINPIQSELKKPEQAVKICRFTIYGLILPVYLVLGLLSYLLLGPIEQVLLWHAFDMTAAQIGMAVLSLTVITKIPLAFNVLRNAVLVQIRDLILFISPKSIPLKNNQLNRLWVAAILLILAGLVSWATDLKVIINLSGGVATTCIGFVIPGACFIRWHNMDKKEAEYKCVEDPESPTQSGSQKKLWIGICAIVLGLLVGGLTLYVEIEKLVS